MSLISNRSNLLRLSSGLISENGADISSSLSELRLISGVISLADISCRVSFSSLLSPESGEISLIFTPVRLSHCSSVNFDSGESYD